MSGTIRVLVVAPGEPCAVRDVENSLAAFQAVVGGYIEVVAPLMGGLVDAHGSVAMYINEDGLSMGLLANRLGMAAVSRKSWDGDVVRGTFVIFRFDGDQDASLTAEQTMAWSAWFDAPARRPVRVDAQASDCAEGDRACGEGATGPSGVATSFSAMVAADMGRLGMLAKTFPSLRERHLTEHPLRDLKRIASELSNGGAVREAARFCLLVWDGAIGVRDPACRFCLRRALRAWDGAHLAAWQAWAAAPWFA